jgi:hypothetical protein
MSIVRTGTVIEEIVEGFIEDFSSAFGASWLFRRSRYRFKLLLTK